MKEITKKIRYYWHALPQGLQIAVIAYLTFVAVVGVFIMARKLARASAGEALAGVSAPVDTAPAPIKETPREIVVDSVDNALLADAFSTDEETSVVAKREVSQEEMVQVANDWLQPQVTQISFRIADLRRSIEKDKRLLETGQPQIEPLEEEVARLEEEFRKANAAMDLPVLNNSSFNEEVEYRYYDTKARLDKARKKLKLLSQSLMGVDKRIAHRENLVKQLEVEASDLRDRLERVRKRDLKLLPVVYEYAKSGMTTLPLLRYLGRSNWEVSFIEDISVAFERQFKRKMPISAYGQSDTHSKMGWDHSNSADVPIHPDSEEGQWLLSYLSSNDVPFLAFRRAMAGVSTGPHFHIGHPSHRLKR